jgi:hypothetical protein
MARKEYREDSSRGECPQKNILMLEDHEGVKRNIRIIHLEKR